MGKKPSCHHASMTTTKSKNENIQLNRLIKVLRPKVYITDSSSFKSLVQQLTGNEPTHYSPDPLLAPSKPQTFDKAMDAHARVQGELLQPESSFQTSFEFDASDVSFDFWNQLVSCSEELIKQSCDHNQHHKCFQGSEPEHLSMTDDEQAVRMVSYHNLEESMLLLEMGDQSPLCNSCCDPIHDEDISIYDYELCGLL